MNSMLSEMLEYSRGSYHLRLERCRLVDIVDPAIQHLEPISEREGITTESTVDDSLEVMADAERLRRVFDNLLSNAIQAEPRGGKVLVTSSLENGDENRVRIDIIDHGSGVPSELRDHIFEPFVTYGKAGGTGLGLAIVQGVINAHHGSVGCEEPPEKGSCFFVILPLASREENDIL
jgi:signal transduction histidine kinase